MPAPRALTIDLEGQQVKVYRNPKNGLFSVQLRGLVVAHLATVQLSSVSFRVTETARQRVLASRHKNVHAYAIGTFTSQAQPAATEAVSYDPYRAGHFYRVSDQAPVYYAAALVLDNGKAYASPPTEAPTAQLSLL